jgi:hypothetical protein
LLVLVFGLILTGMTHKFSQWWISVSLTLFVVAFILLMLILRDQRRAITALDAATGTPVAGMAVADNVEEDIRADAAQAAAAAAAAGPEAGPVAGGEPAAGAVPAGARTGRHAAIAAPPAAAGTADQRVAAVERGRIASIGGVTALIWLVILVLMVWH